MHSTVFSPGVLFGHGPPGNSRGHFSPTPMAAERKFKGLVENIGGGTYRVRTQVQGGQKAEFFRIDFNEP